MRLIQWDKLDTRMKNTYVEEAYNHLKNKSFTLLIKRLFDVMLSLILLILFFPIMIIIAFFVKINSKGPIIFKQKRITQFYKEFTIYKFRTMVNNAENEGDLVTTKYDSRITKVGKILRKIRFDEFPQLINIFKGEMSFVGTRPEIPEMVSNYTDEMFITLLIPAGLTSRASINFKEESQIIKEDAHSSYLNHILPEKMKYNIEYIKKMNIFEDIKIIFLTAINIFN